MCIFERKNLNQFPSLSIIIISDTSELFFPELHFKNEANLFPCKMVLLIYNAAFVHAFEMLEHTYRGTRTKQ